MSAALALRGVTLAFGGVIAVDGLDLEVAEGEVFALVGPNGAGKSTVLNLVSRLYEPRSGDILLHGESLLGRPAHALAAAGVARTFQNVELFEGATVLQNLLVGRHRYRRTGMLAELLFLPSVREAEREHRRAAEEVIAFLGLEPHRDRRIAGLPYGVRKVVELGRALACGPRLLLLDEPASGLSAEETREMAFWIRDIRERMGITVLMVEHDMALVGAVSDRVMAMADGRALALGTPAQVRSDPAVIEAYLGTPAEADA